MVRKFFETVMGKRREIEVTVGEEEVPFRIAIGGHEGRNPHKADAHGWPVTFQGFESFQFVLSHATFTDVTQWIVSEATTGCRIAEGEDEDDALTFAAWRLEKMGHERVRQSIETAKSWNVT